ncbi:MAG: 30S ribosomal protein S8 [Spirochaetales bacterium]|nr:30S ribosomal protein S8 [Leptospiraceae bacterium]MCP5480118.1 30S ribosomal protein S8 [Spirochaetales bacterium]MCP5485542.1 30S ribosomal protein S8 [Spirochaetales bacterium]
MSLTDPIADMLTRLRNASRARHPEAAFPGSRQKVAILDILKREGYIAGYVVKDEEKKQSIQVKLKYAGREPVIRQLERVSKPGRRHYVNARDLKPVRNNMGIAIVSTSQGVMTGRKAKKLNIGGEVICRVW